MLCPCGCGQRATPIATSETIRQYIHGHNRTEDMSSRFCSQCGSNKTYIKKPYGNHKTTRPMWHRANGKPICNNCYRRQLYSKSDVKRRKVQQDRKYYRKNRVKILKQKREHIISPQYNSKRRERYKKDNNYRELILKRNRERYRNNSQYRERMKQRTREWRRNNPERANEAVRKCQRKKRNTPPERYRV